MPGWCANARSDRRDRVDDPRDPFALVRLDGDELSDRCISLKRRHDTAVRRPPRGRDQGRRRSIVSAVEALVIRPRPTAA